MTVFKCSLITLLFVACTSISSKNNQVANQIDILDTLHFSDSDKKAIGLYRKDYDSLSQNPDFDSSLSEKIITTDTFSPKNKAIDFGATSNIKTISKEAIDFGATSKEASLSTSSAHNSKNIEPQDPVAIAVHAAASYRQQHPSQETELADIEKNVNWIFSEGNNNPPTRPETYLAKVSYFGYTFIRGWVDANTCGSNAVLLASLGRRDEAMSWLAAAQNHAPSIVDEFMRNYNYTLDYTLAHFGYNVLGAYFGTYFPGYNKILDAIQGRYSDYHPDPHVFDPPPVIEHNGDRQRGRN